MGLGLTGWATNSMTVALVLRNEALGNLKGEVMNKGIKDWSLFWSHEAEGDDKLLTKDEIVVVLAVEVNLRILNTEAMAEFEILGEEAQILNA